MSSSDGSALLAAVRWSDDAHYLNEFLHKCQLPQVARVVKGQYLSLGVPSLSNPSLSQTVFLCSTAKRLKVAAQCVKFKEGKKVVTLGPKLAIPDNYDGWFEILSEDGRCTKCLDSVAELARRFPDACLVRENIKAYVATGDPTEETITDKVRTIACGETLVLVSEVLGTSAYTPANENKGRNAGGGGGGGGRFLRCFDARGESVYLSLEQKGRFSAIAREDNISGVHSIKTLLAKRFPLMVRLVHGKPPVGGAKTTSSFVPEMRLLASFDEDCVMALPLHKEPAMVAIPLGAQLKLQGPKNPDVVHRLKEHARLAEKCNLLMEEVATRIQVFDMLLANKQEVRASVSGNPSEPNCSRNAAGVAAGGGVGVAIRRFPYIRRSLSDPYGNRPVTMLSCNPLHPPNTTPTTTTTTTTQVTTASTESSSTTDHHNDTRYDEIDQIYDYVRGFAPLPKTTPEEYPTITTKQPTTTVSNNPNSNPATATSGNVAGEVSKPEPPPIETIPGRRFSESCKTTHVSGGGGGVGGGGGGVQEKRSSENIYERIPRKISDPTPIGVVGGVAITRCPGGGGTGGPQGRNKSTTSSSSRGNYYIHGRTSSKIYNMKTSAVPLPRISGQLSGQGHSVHKPRLFRPNKSLPVVKDCPKTIRSGKSKSITTSPIFNIRYKSLTDLAVDLGGTLDSSNSGGKVSAAGSFILPPPGGELEEKCSVSKKKMLTRPKSLSNLVWDVNQVQDCTTNHLIMHSAPFKGCRPTKSPPLNNAVNNNNNNSNNNKNNNNNNNNNITVNNNNHNKSRLFVGSSNKTKRLGTLYL